MDHGRGFRRAELVKCAKQLKRCRAPCVVGDMMVGMASQRQARIAALNDPVRDAGESIICAADFSPGPWWGFNGVDTLAVTEGYLWMARIPFSWPFRPGRVHVSRKPCEAIRDVQVTRRRALIPGAPEVVTFRFTEDHRTHTFTAKAITDVVRLVALLRV